MDRHQNDELTDATADRDPDRVDRGTDARAAPGHRTLRRSKKDRVIAGVSGGLGRYLGIEPVIFRIAFLLLLIPGGIGLVFYLIGWLAIPDFKNEREEEWDNSAPPVRRGMAGVIVGGTLILLGLLILLQQIVPWFDSRIIGALILIVVGAAVVIRGMRSERDNA